MDFSEEEEQENGEHLSLSDAIDSAILMHRDVHFGGKFEFMLDYYRREGKGINPEFKHSRIEELAVLEKQAQHNLAAMLVSGAEAERVARAKKAYKELRNLYEIESSNPKYKIPLLIAELILSEKEDPEEEIQAIVAEKGAIVPALLELLRAEEFYDLLFPGYGLAPALAMRCLGLIGDKRAIIGLFEASGEEDFFTADLALHALQLIGQPAKEFLLRVLQSQPINIDNERAAIALVQFKEDPLVAEACFALLKKLDWQNNIVLAAYLILACEGLCEATHRAECKALASDPKMPAMLRLDMILITKAWEKE